MSSQRFLTLRPAEPEMERPFIVQEQGEALDAAALMRRVALRDQAALDELLQAYWGTIVAYISRMVNDVDVAGDIAQETFLRVWERGGDWHGGSFRAFVFRIARNLTLDEIRRRQARERAELRSLVVEGKSPHTPLELLERHELIERVDEIVQGLSPRRREAFTLVYLQGLSYREAADIMEVSVKTIGNQLTDAIAELRERMGPYMRSARD